MSSLTKYLYSLAVFLMLVLSSLIFIRLFLLLHIHHLQNENVPTNSKFTISELMSMKFSHKTSNDTDMDVCKSTRTSSGLVESNCVMSMESSGSRNKRAVSTKISPADRVWDQGVIPFEVDPHFDGAHRLLFQQAMRHWENHTCVKFIERQPQLHPNFIYFTVLSCGCCSFVGRRGNGGQTISIGRNCDKFGVVVHELGHVIGFWHEHTRPDRDEYVTIETANIIGGQEFNFDKQLPREVNTLGVPYDYDSIMHYAPNTFAKPYLDTIFPVRQPNISETPKIGQRIRLSSGDIRRANLMYQCPACGRTFLGQTGEFNASDYYGASGMGQKCEWRIVTTHGENIVLRIRKLSPLKCIDGEYLEVRDGYWNRSRSLGKFCDQKTVPASIKSSTNRMSLTLQLNNSSKLSLIGFSASYESVCGGKMRHSGRLESPNYPSQYPGQMECVWEISVAPGFQVALKFQSFEIEKHDNCSYDFIEMRDGASKELIGRFCGFDVPPNLTSRSNRMLVRFLSDGSVEKTGFTATFIKEVDECALKLDGCEQQCVNTLGGFECLCHFGYELHSNKKSCEHACGGVLVASNGTITSPSFPDVYPKSKKCVWELTVPVNYLITLTFTHFDLESDSIQRQQGCDYDSLMVYSVVGDMLRKHGKFCGTGLPPTVTSQQHKMRLVFLSDRTIQKSGFAIIFRSELNECRISNGGCQHICTKIPGSYSCSCSNGYVLHLNGRNCTVGGCNFEINKAAVVRSPNFPAPYPANADCVWHIIVTPGHRLRLQFTIFQVEPHPDCTNDYVDIYKGSSANSFKLGRYCGFDVKLPVVVAPSNEVFMMFRSDSSTQAIGFEAKILTECGGRLSAVSNQVRKLFSHSNFDKALYGNDVRCQWTIEAKPGQSVRIAFLEFSLEDGDQCESDYVEISENEYDGVFYGRFCGKDLPPDIVSTKEVIVIQLVTDEDMTMDGFLIEYVAVDRMLEMEESIIEEFTPFPGYF